MTELDVFEEGARIEFWTSTGWRRGVYAGTVEGKHRVDYESQSVRRLGEKVTRSRPIENGLVRLPKPPRTTPAEYDYILMRVERPEEIPAMPGSRQRSFMGDVRRHLSNLPFGRREYIADIPIIRGNTRQQFVYGVVEDLFNRTMESEKAHYSND